MRSQEFLPEIERLSRQDYTGGKSSLYAGRGRKQYRPLPGGSGLLYTIEAGGRYDGPMVKLWTPVTDQPEPQRDSYEYADEFRQRYQTWQRQKSRGQFPPQIIAVLNLENTQFPLPGALQVGSITVDEDYRGQGLAKALYGIVLSIMRRPLVAGSSQTPGGRRNWVSLSQIPGVTIQGYVAIADDRIETYTDEIMTRLGGNYLGHMPQQHKHYWNFPVQTNRTGQELEALVKSQLAKIYNEHYSIGTGLYAVWSGQ